jgi:hypothetical protein
MNIKELKEICEKADKGPWSLHPRESTPDQIWDLNGDCIGLVYGYQEARDNGNMICQSRTALPEALELIEEAMEIIEYQNSLCADPVKQAWLYKVKG